MTAAFEPGIRGGQVWLELADRRRITLPVHRWHASPDHGDEVLLRACTGPTLDLGCGPGRLTAALAARGVIALGVDVSPHAVALTRRRGAPALHRDVFHRLPREGSWQHALLADGNIGIGGAPAALLRRTAELLCPGGSALVELERPGTGLRRGRVRVTDDGGHPSPWFEWAWLGVDALAETTAGAGLRAEWVTEHGGRWFAELRKP
ncbi:MAG TPA: class I SAM-dependent methyltransferase [Amycolatopsis sp.]|nr:class I SAM-dependent methyltransferase [Amycolatopsis sp.]